MMTRAYAPCSAWWAVSARMAPSGMRPAASVLNPPTVHRNHEQDNNSTSTGVKNFTKKCFHYWTSNKEHYNNDLLQLTFYKFGNSVLFKLMSWMMNISNPWVNN